MVAVVAGVMGTMLRQAVGSFKDRAAIGKAMVRSGHGGGALSEMEIAVVRATAHEECPTEEKYVHEILFLVSNSPGSTPFLARRISRRLRRTRDPVVALKTLLLVHRLVRGGDRNFELQLRNARLSGDLSFDPPPPRRTRRRRRRRGGQEQEEEDDDDEFEIFVGGYVRFLEERMGWVINQAGKLEPSLVVPPDQGRLGGELATYYEDKLAETIFFRLPKCQTFLDRIMDCFPLGINVSSPSHSLVQAALCNILREGFQVYASFCEGVTTLVDSFLDLKKSARASALAIFRRASSQTHRLYDFFEDCKRSISNITASNLDFPSVRLITPDCITALEEYFSASTTSSTVVFPNGSFSSALEKPVIARGNHDAVPFFFDDPVLFASPKLETKICTVWVRFDEEEAKKKPISDDQVPKDMGGEALPLLQIEEGAPYQYYNPFFSSPRTKTGNFLRG